MKNHQKKNYSNSSTPERIINRVLNDNYEEKKKQEKKEENNEFNNLNIENENDYEPISFGYLTKQNFFNDNLSENDNEQFNFSKLFEGNKLIENEDEYDENNMNLNKQKISENELLNGLNLKDFLNNDFGKKLFNSNPFSYTIHKGKLSDLLDDKNKTSSFEKKNINDD